jgi:predicted metalloprotease with PDZ domain
LKRWLLALALLAAAAAGSVVPHIVSSAAEPVRYRFSFPEPSERWMQVDATFTELGAAPLQLRISRSSPGRYARHDFAKNVYDVHAYAADGRELRLERPDAAEWNVPAHAESVKLKYKVYGDRVDGTYLAIDTSHAHINMPAAIMWARGLDDRPITLTVSSPAGMHWQIATQLHGVNGDGSPSDERRPVPDDQRAPVPDHYEFTAPNLQYLIDSPVEFGPLMIETFMVGPRTFRFAAHQTGTKMELQAFVKDVAAIVQQEEAIFGEFPSYEPGFYTFLADYVPYASIDGMEHRNSTVMTSPGSIANARVELLDTVAHEFFHSWNVERIRPRSLEPFDLDRPNTSGELWFAEGFTQYYGPLAMQRAGLLNLGATARTLTTVLNNVGVEAGRLVRSAEELSRLAVLTDRTEADPPSPVTEVMSYYQLGAAIALALDLSLRDRSNGQLSLDDFMREMWSRYGKPGGAREGYVDRPYTVADAEATLASVSGDPAFARDFFARYIHGLELADYRRLLMSAGLLVRPASRSRVEIVPVESTGGSLTASQREFRDKWLGAK